MEGERLQVFLNGTKINDFTNTDPARSLTQGYIGIQNHGSPDVVAVPQHPHQGTDHRDALAVTLAVTLPSPSPSPSTGTTSALRGVASGRCLDISGASQANGAIVQIWDCNGQANQRWTSTAASELRVYGGKCLDVSGNGTANGTGVSIWDCNGQNNQKWRFNSDGSITAIAANKCLDVVGSGTANGSRLHIWTCHGGGNQKWTRPD